MKTLRDLLLDADPAAADDRLSEEEAAAIRRRAVAEAAAVPPPRAPWREAFAIAAAVVLMIAVGVTAGRRLAAPTTAVHFEPGDAARGETRQLQFATPGGTRIIWTFDPQFSVTETNP